MTTTRTTSVSPTAAGPILAIDLGKYKCVACVYRSAADHAFQSVPTSPDDLARLIARARPAVVVVEACTPAGWVHELCAELGVRCAVANTASDQWKYKHTKRKTDRDDALRLAQLFALGQLPEVVVPARRVREWRALIAHRQALVARRVAAQNRVRAVLVGQGLPAPRGAKAWTASGLAGIGQLARPLAECAPDELWRGLLDLALADYRQAEALVAQAEAKLDALGKADPKVQLLETAPGVGPRTAEAVVAYLDDPRRFKSGKQVGAYGGLVPRQYQSGEDDRRGRISKRGPAVLRKLLVQCAWAGLRHSPWVAAVYKRLSRGRPGRSRPSWPWPGSCWSGCGPCSGTGCRGGPTRGPTRGWPPDARPAVRVRPLRPPETPTGASRASSQLGVPQAGGRQGWPNEWAARRIG